MKTGLVLEGGAMRGMFPAGVLDVMMEHGIKPDGIVGVSAGACFGCNYKSCQPGRAIRYNKAFAKDKRYCSVWSLVKTGDIFNADFAYHVVPVEYDPFDNEAFESNEMEFHVVCTDVMTGKPVYHVCDKGGHEFFEWVRASASMPVVSNVVEIGGYRLLDGGMSDSIPLEYFEGQGFERNLVILTQPAGYVKRPIRMLPLLRLALRKYPAVIEAMRVRHEMYNSQLAYVACAEREGRALVIRPSCNIPIGHVCHDPEQMQAVYEMGRAEGEKRIEEINLFFNNY